MRKGQAAIEYLATYGWMLAAVAMVSGIIYSSTGASFCNSQVSGFSIYSSQVNDFGLTAGENTMQLDIQNSDPQGLKHNLTRVTVQDRNMEERQRTVNLDQRVGPGQSSVIEVSGIQESSSCNTFDVEIIYDRGFLLPNQKASGTITSSAEIVDSTNVATTFETDITGIETTAPGEESNITYQVENTGKEGTQTVELEIDGTTVLTDTITLTSYETTTRTYKHIFTSTGEHSLSLASENTTESGTVNIPEPPTEFTLQNINAPTEASVGGNMDVSAEVVSETGSATSQAELDIDGNTEATKTITVNDGQTETVSFNDVSLDGLSSGEHDLSITFEGETITDTVTLIEKPLIERLVLYDKSKQYGNANYTLEYEVSNTQNFQELQIRFDDLESDYWGDRTYTNTEAPVGTRDHNEGSFGDDFEITVEAINKDGDTTDTVTLNDNADGLNTFYPSDLDENPNNPKLESYSITSEVYPTTFTLDYNVNNSDNFRELIAEFENLDDTDPWYDVDRTSNSAPSGTINYPDKWNANGDQYNITIKVRSTAGIIVDSQSVLVSAGESTSSGDGSNTEQPSITEFAVTDQSQCSGNNCNGQNEASYQVDWSASDPNGNLESANVTFNGNVPGGNWESISGSETYTKNGEHGTEYTIRFQASYSSGEYLCEQVTDTADEGSGISGSYTDCS